MKFISKYPKHIYWVMLAFLLVLSIFVYKGCLDNGFLSDWDDGTYVINNQKIKSLHGDSVLYTVKQSFQSFTYGHYHPLTTLSYAIDYTLYGLNPNGFHLSNLVIHLLNILLVSLFIFLLTSNYRIAIITSILFALHPTHVESVSWIAGRKDLLCTFFYLLTLIVYVQYLNKRTLNLYAITFVLFFLALISKAMAVSLPLVLLLIDYYKNRKITFKIFSEKIPFFILSLIFVFVAIIAQKSNEALVDSSDYTVIDRFIFSSYALIRYLVKALNITDISTYYTYPSGSIPTLYYFTPLILGLIAFLLYKIKTIQKDLLFGVLFFFSSIVLVLQFVAAGNVIMADRYTYLPYIGIFFVIASAINNLITIAKNKTPVFVYYFVLCFFTIACIIVTQNQINVWNNSMSFWNFTIERSPGAPLAYNNRAALYINSRELEKALADLNTAIKIKPDYVEAYYNRGIAKVGLNMLDDAIKDYSYVINKKPGDIESVLCNRGNAFLFKNDYKNALSDYNLAIKHKPDFSIGHYSKGLVFYNLGNYSEAIVHFNKAIELYHDFAQAYYLRALCNKELNDYESARNDVIIAQKMGYPVEPTVVDAIGLRYQ